MNAFNGIGIQHKNGKIYSIDGWDRRGYNPDEARGIAVGNGEHSLCLYKNAGRSFAWSYDEKQLIPGVYTTENIFSAMTDFNGKENTDAVLKAVEDSLIKDAPAAQWVRRIYGSDAYLPAGGELVMIIRNKGEISKCSDLIGGNLFKMFDADYWYPWSSTQYSYESAWLWNHCDSRLNFISKGYDFGHSYALGCAVI